jgi:tetratricopeptide (TPR) repeat protein
MSENKDTLIEKAEIELLASLSAYSVKSGLPLQVWDKMQTILFTLSKRPQTLIFEINSLLPGIDELALEAGQYSLAIELGLKPGVSLAKAFLFTAAVQKVEALIQFLKESDRPLEVALIQMIQFRLQGKLQEAAKIFTGILEPALSELSLELRAEALSQYGSVALHSNSFSVALDHYRTAFEIYETLHRRGKQAISCYNIAVCFSHLGSRLETNSYLWRTHEILSSYHLGTLELTVGIFEIENLIPQGVWSQVIERSRSILQNSHMSAVQKVIAHQSLATGLMELGQANEAEAECNHSRSLINRHRFFQFEMPQMALEQNLESMIHRRIVRSKFNNSPSSSPNLRQQILYKESQARKSIVMADPVRAHRLIREIRNLNLKLPHPMPLPSDLEVFESEQISSPMQAARALEAQVLMAFSQRNTALLAGLVKALNEETEEQNVWKKTLIPLGQAMIEVLKRNFVVALGEAMKAVNLTEVYGLERLQTLGLGLAFASDSHAQLAWIERINQIDAAERPFFEELFARALGRNLFDSRFAVSTDTVEMLTKNQESNTEGAADLVIDEKLGEVLWQGQLLPISSKGLAFRVLAKIALSRGDGLNKESLVQNVWGFDYDPSVHDNLIYTNIRRLRDLIPIELHAGAYRISPKIQWKLLTDSKTTFVEQSDLNERQKKILKSLDQNDQPLSRGLVVHLLKVSERTALRDLTSLVTLGHLQRVGSGRSAQYRKHRKYSEAL